MSMTQLESAGKSKCCGVPAMSFGIQDGYSPYCETDVCPKCHSVCSILDESEPVRKPLSIAEMELIVEDCKYLGRTFEVSVSPTTQAIYLQAWYMEDDTVTGKLEKQHTRRWLLSPEMTKSEIVATAFKCVITSMEHQAREWFTYKGRAIYHPHHDVDKLLEICETREERHG